METVQRIVDLLGKIALLFVLIWVVGFRIFNKIWDKISR